MTSFSQPGLVHVDLVISHDGDWNDSFAATDLANLDDCKVEVYVRPTYDSDVLIKYLTSESDGVIISEGEAVFSMNVPRDDVIDDFPIGEWTYFAVLTNADDVIQEMWRGRLTVLPASLVGSYDGFTLHAGVDDLVNSMALVILL